MTANEYQKLAMRTLNPALSERDMLVNGVMGLCGEAGEAIDIVKKHLAQGHALDRERLAQELGDIAWYLAETATALGYSLEDILRMNLEKLQKRYPDGFEEERSVRREGGQGDHSQERAREVYEIVDVGEEHLPAVKAFFKRELMRESIPEWSADEDDYPLCMLPGDVGSAIAMLGEGGRIVAYAAWHEHLEEVAHMPWRCEGRPAYFHRLLVDGEYRGKGIAKRMLEELKRRAKNGGCACYRFVVYPQNERAVGVYERMGIRCLGAFESPWKEYGDGGVVLLYEMPLE